MKEPTKDKNEEFDEDEFDFDESEFDFEDDEFGDEFDEEFEEQPPETQEEISEAPLREKARREPPSEKTAPPPENAAQPTAQLPTQPPMAEPAPASTIMTIDEIPLALSVEVGRIEISIKKLMELEAGNLLDIGITPEQGVDLIVGGKCIARGELLQIGGTLGVRILEKL